MRATWRRGTRPTGDRQVEADERREAIAAKRSHPRASLPAQEPNMPEAPAPATNELGENALGYQDGHPAPTDETSPVLRHYPSNSSAVPAGGSAGHPEHSVHYTSGTPPPLPRSRVAPPWLSERRPGCARSAHPAPSGALGDRRPPSWKSSPCPPLAAGAAGRPPRSRPAASRGTPGIRSGTEDGSTRYHPRRGTRKRRRWEV